MHMLCSALLSPSLCRLIIQEKDKTDEKKLKYNLKLHIKVYAYLYIKTDPI